MLRPHMTMCKIYEEAAEQVDIKLLQNQKVLQYTEDAAKSQEDNAEDSEASSESEEDDDEDAQEDELERDAIEDEGSDTEVLSNNVTNLFVCLHTFLTVDTISRLYIGCSP